MGDEFWMYRGELGIFTGVPGDPDCGVVGIGEAVLFIVGCTRTIYGACCGAHIVHWPRNCGVA